jgi:hypothetical protein
MSRNHLFFTAPIVVLVILVGLFAMKSRGSDNDAQVQTKPTKNCPPVARADAAATKPGSPISIDVLANDTDPDGDPLVFQIRKTTGGDSTIDDGGTPTDASDDRVLFTPAADAPPEATIDYQALDPDGALSDSTVTVVINADGVLPPDVHSDEVPTDDQGSSADCGTGKVSTTTTSEEVITDESTTTEVSAPPVTNQDGSTATTVKKKTSTKGGHTTTTRRGSTTTQPHTTTTQPHPTTTQPRPTTTATTQPQSTTTTQPDPCGPYPFGGTQDQKDKWVECEQARNK